jgi:hypothetical protein
MAKLNAKVQVTREGDGPPLILLHCLGVDPPIRATMKRLPTSWAAEFH